MKTICRAVALLFLLATPVHAQIGGGFTAEQSGVFQGRAQTWNASTGINCTLSGSVWTCTANGSGGGSNTSSPITGDGSAGTPITCPTCLIDGTQVLTASISYTYLQNPTANATGFAFNFTAGKGGDSDGSAQAGAGGNWFSQTGQGGAGTASKLSGNGGIWFLQGGNAGTSGGAGQGNGGNIHINAGGGGANGLVGIGDNALRGLGGKTGFVQIGNTSDPIYTFMTSPAATAGAGLRNVNTRNITRSSSVAPPDCAGGTLTLSVTQFLDAAIATCGTAQTINFPTWQGASGIVQGLPGNGAAIGQPAVGDVVEFTVSASAGSAITVGAGTGGTISGSTTVPANTAHTYMCRLTSVAANSETATCY